MKQIVRPTTIKGLSEQRRLPRLGKIRLGIKKVSPKGVEYPSETDYFVVPPEVVKVYGEKPKELDIMIPVEDSNISIPQAYEMYGSGKGLKCVGDGEIAFRLDDKSHEMNEIDCPCEHFGHACKQRAHLRFILPKVNVGGVYQIDTSSYNSIIDLNSSMDYIRALIGRVALVPLKLKRTPTETHHDGKKQTHYTLKLELEADINFINQLRENTSRILMQAAQYSLPPPVTENPAIDEGATTQIANEENALPETFEPVQGIIPPPPIVDPTKKQILPTDAVDGKTSQPYGGRTVVGIVAVTQQKGETNGKPWIKYKIKSTGGEWATFDKKIAELAKLACKGGYGLLPVLETKGKYTNIIGFERIPADVDETQTSAKERESDEMSTETIDDINIEPLPWETLDK